jgi:hypothetical protein
MVANAIEQFEQMITDFLWRICRTVLCFCEPYIQSIILTIIHYVIFIVGIYVFYFIAKPRSTYKKIFFIFTLASYLAYLLFDKCIFSSIEHKIYRPNNPIQNMMNGNFGDGEIGKTVSKSNLFMITLFTGLSLIYDYRICPKKH